MKRFLLATLALSSAGAFAAGMDPNRIRDLDAKDNDILAGPKGNLDMFVAADRVLSLGGDLPGHRGYGATLGLFVMPETYRSGGWRSIWGGELSGFRTTANGSLNGRDTDEELYALTLVGDYGVLYGFANRWEIGCTVGAGIGAFYGAIDDGSSTHSKGNWDWVVQVKPQLTYRLESGAWLFLGYRLAYMTPVYDTEMLGRPTTKITCSAIEFGAVWRF